MFNPLMLSLLCVTFCTFSCGLPYFPRLEDFDLAMKPNDYDDKTDVNTFLPEDSIDEEAEDALVYDIFLQSLLGELEEEEKEKELELEDEDVVTLNQDSLKELKELESVLSEEINDQDDDNWIEDASVMNNNLPLNYHNTSVIHRKIGQNNVNMKEAIDKTTDKNKQSIKISNVFESFPAKPDSSFKCSLSDPCDDDQYCYKTPVKSECYACHSIGSTCIDNAQCCSNDESLSLCVEGTCRIGVRPGSIGTICDELDDCRPGMCCALTLGYPRRLCKPLAKINQRCSTAVNLADDIVMIGPDDHFCPCEAELSCINQKPMFYEKNILESDDTYICKRSDEYINEPNSQQARKFGSEMGLLSAADNDDQWQPRMETVNDQRFVNPSEEQHHASYKKSWNLQPAEDLMM